MKFTRLAATLNEMSMDRSDVQHAAKEKCTNIAKPTLGSWKRLQKAKRYLTGVTKMTWSDQDKLKVNVRVDSDWAFGLERQSASRGMMMISGNCGEALVEETSGACSERGRVRVLRRHGDS